MGGEIDVRAMIGAIEAAGMSRAELARCSGLAKGTVSKLANLDVREPKHSTFEKIEKIYLRVSPRKPFR